MIVEKEHSITFMAPDPNPQHKFDTVEPTVFPYGTYIREGLAMGVNTWDDWHLIPTSRPEIVAPEVYTNYVDLPGAHGKLDLSEYLTGGPVFKNRSGSLQFYALAEHGFWAERYNQICNFLHGRRLQMVLYDEPEYFYTGRFRVESWQSDGQTNWSTVTINYELDPFKFLLPAPSDQTAQGYWERYLFPDIHKYNFLSKIPLYQGNDSVSRTLHLSGYTYGFMLDGFIDDTSTSWPCACTVTVNGTTIGTWTKTESGGFTTKTNVNLQPIDQADNTIIITPVSGKTKVNLVCYGGHL